MKDIIMDIIPVVLATIGTFLIRISAHTRDFSRELAETIVSV